MTDRLRLAEAARLLGVSDDTIRRWVASGRLTSTADPAGVQVVDGAELARVAVEQAGGYTTDDHHSHRNRMRGIVTRVVRDTVMAQVDVQAGPYRLVSLISREAVDALGLEPGVVVTTTIKATSVGVERGEL